MRVGFLRRSDDRSERIDQFFENLLQQDPEWLRPPDRAAYPVAGGATTQTAAVVLDPGTDDLLATIATDVSRRVGDSAEVNLWFSQESASADLLPVVAAHVGSHRVGTVSTEQAALLADVFRAAAFFDEDPVAKGTLSRPGNHWYLEFRLPGPPPPLGAPGQPTAG